MVRPRQVAGHRSLLHIHAQQSHATPHAALKLGQLRRRETAPVFHFLAQLAARRRAHAVGRAYFIMKLNIFGQCMPFVRGR